MVQIGKYVLLTKGEIGELNKILSEHKDEISGVRKEMTARINTIIDIIKPTLPLKKRKAIEKLIKPLNSDLNNTLSSGNVQGNNPKYNRQ